MWKDNVKYFKSKIGFSLLFIVSIVTWLVKGNTQFEVSYFTIENQEIPERFDSYRIAHLSDLHSKDWGTQLIDAIENEEPEIIVITGDLIDSRTVDFYPVLEFIGDIVQIAPIYYVPGNHESRNKQYKSFENNLIKQGVVVLNNEAVIVEIEDEKITILGLQDPSFIGGNSISNKEKIEVDTILNETIESVGGYKLLLSHRPELFDTYVENEIDLVFSGHAHGGQVRLPFIGGVIAPNQGLFPTYTSGVYQEGNTSMIVSRGLGNSIIPLRINNPPELVIVELKR